MPREAKKKPYPPDVHEVGIHTPGVLGSDRHRDPVFLQWYIWIAVI